MRHRRLACVGRILRLMRLYISPHIWLDDPAEDGQSEVFDTGISILANNNQSFSPNLGINQEPEEIL